MKLPKTESVGVNDASAQRMLPPCVFLRRCFIRKFLCIAAALSFVGLMSHAGYYPAYEETTIFEVLCDYFFAYLWLVCPVFGVLYIPARTKCGSLLQLVGVLLPLLITVYVCCAGWNSTPNSTDEFAYAMGMFLLGWGGIVCFLLTRSFVELYAIFHRETKSAEEISLRCV